MSMAPIRDNILTGFWSEFDHKGSFNNKPALFGMMVWYRTGDTPLSVPMMTQSTYRYMSRGSTKNERNLEVRSPLVVFVVGGFAFSQKNNALCVTICNNRVWCVSSGYQHWRPKSLGIALPNMNSSVTQIKAQNHLIVILWSCHIIQHLLSHTISVMASHNFYTVHFYCIFLNKNCCPFIQFH